MRHPLIKVLICLSVLFCQTLLAATDKFILLPNQDGSTGAIVISSPKGSKLIKKAYTLVKVDEAGNFVVIKSNALCVDQDFDNALATLPKPKEFVLTFGSDNTPSNGPHLDSEAQNMLKNIMAHINVTPVPFVILTGDAKSVAYLQKILLDTKVQGLVILLDILATQDPSVVSPQILVTVK